MRKNGFRSVFVLILVVLSILVCFPFTACNASTSENAESSQSSSASSSQSSEENSSKPSEIKYVVSFDSAGGTEISSQTVIAGGKVEKPADPVKSSTPTEEYTFIGWYVGDKIWNFELDTVTNDLSLIAKYSVKKSTIQYK